MIINTFTLKLLINKLQLILDDYIRQVDTIDNSVDILRVQLFTDRYSHQIFKSAVRAEIREGNQGRKP